MSIITLNAAGPYKIQHCAVFCSFENFKDDCLKSRELERMYHVNMITVNYNMTIQHYLDNKPLVMFLREFVTDSVQSYQNSNGILHKIRKK